MNQRIQISAPPLVKSHTVKIERGLVGRDTTSTRAKFDNMLGREVNELSQLSFALPDLLFRLLCSGNIHRGPDKFYDVARLVQDRMADRMQVLDGSVGKNN